MSLTQKQVVGVEISDEGVYTVLADNGIGVPADASVELRVDDSLSKRIPGKLSKYKNCLISFESNRCDSKTLIF